LAGRIADVYNAPCRLLLMLCWGIGACFVGGRGRVFELYHDKSITYAWKWQTSTPPTTKGEPRQGFAFLACGLPAQCAHELLQGARLAFQVESDLRFAFYR
jgi:hypothetical protein